jgi:hypothetical protein
VRIPTIPVNRWKTGRENDKGPGDRTPGPCLKPT